MKKTLIGAIVIVALAIAAAILFIPGTSEAESQDEGQTTEAEELIVYAYDSFASDWGPGPEISERFEQEYGITVRLQSVGDAGQVLQKAILEKDDPKADILIGIDNNLITRAKNEDVLEAYTTPNLDKVPQDLVFDPQHYVTPYDYGYFSIIYDTEKIDTPPTSLEDLTAPRFEDKLILMDPRTSSPGLGFLMWTIYAYGDEFTEYWEQLQSSILTISEGWDSGYGLFTSGEAPLVLSYTSSPAYHVEYEDSQRYQAALFEEGHYMQIEGVGMVKDAPHPEAAKRFIDFVLTEGFQEVIPLTNWMYPVLPEIELPESYDFAPQPEKRFYFEAEKIDANRDEWIDSWSRAVTR
ncbi:MAG TPA: thiamine ABC transporter substrate binding subunit [Clostridia bacterium]|nr:thiamine ABC transporter substrate binding subunit [Clostridia bacterium]